MDNVLIDPVVAQGGEAVAYQTRYPGDPWIECRRDWYEAVKAERPQDARALYTTPQPLAVSDAMVDAALTAHEKFYETDTNYPESEADFNQGGFDARAMRAALTAALNPAGEENT